VAKRGAKSKLTEERRKSILDSVRLGLTFKMAAEIAGIHPDTLALWRKNNTQFFRDMQRAESDGIRERLARISRHGGEDWKADAWILSHRRPEMFSERRIVDLNTGENKSPYELMNMAIDSGGKAEDEDE
jgi:hypothetical protein